MRLSSFLLTLTVLAAPIPAIAAKVSKVDIHGLDEAMTANVRGALSLEDAIGKEIPGRRLGYLVRVAEDETREALEPFGYYAPEIQVDRVRGDKGTDVTITVKPGQPVRVRNSDIAILGAGGDDRYLKEDLAAFTPHQGDIFNHALYEASKTRITRRLAERGYFDADFNSRRVEVTRADHAADIDLVWTSGDRYNMGAVTFTQAPKQIISESLLNKLIYWKEGQYYHQGRLDRLRKSLSALDYFSRIDIEPQPENATLGPEGDKRVPVQVTLTPAKRSIYTAGLSYGTDSGAGIRLGVERRYLNQRGHKALAQVDWAQKRKTATLQYRIPAFAWLDGWYTISAQLADEQTDYIDSRRIEFVGSRSGQYNRNLNLVASMHLLRERWAYVTDDDGDAATPVQYRYATFLYPSLRAEYVDVDDRLFPRRGIGGFVVLRTGLESLGSDASFGQLQARASWFKGLGERNRLIVRGEIGHTFTNALVDMPPSLRFYAGGDRSIRGYEYREVGPRIEKIEITGSGRERRVDSFAIGAKNLLTGSVEFERYFTDTLGAAVFVDSGDAFDGTKPDWRTGVGVGARYKSPVGPIRFDIARGLNDPDSPFTIGLSIGAEF
ncbi:autotransporter assembly complex protein TamA [Luteimonas aquatica]|uniref:autotransporter assembly complex protein TamA n=1 Tax=Luteimonas aquatica TaxID=450364 RepID=UPI001F56E137|nr:autotransporter assembly complex family protein [Luteimonas aquatica]